MSDETQKNESVDKNIKVISEDGNIDQDGVANENIMDVVDNGIQSASQALGENLQQQEASQEELGINKSIINNV